MSRERSSGDRGRSGEVGGGRRRSEEVAETNLVDVIGLWLLVETVVLLQLLEKKRGREQGRRGEKERRREG